MLPARTCLHARLFFVLASWPRLSPSLLSRRNLLINLETFLVDLFICIHGIRCYFGSSIDQQLLSKALGLL